MTAAAPKSSDINATENEPSKGYEESGRAAPRFGVCPDCNVSRIPPFLTRCSRCCDTELKQAEQALACELNKAFYGDDEDDNPSWWGSIKLFFRSLICEQ